MIKNLSDANMNDKKIVNLISKVLMFLSCFYTAHILAASEFAIKVPVTNMFSKPEQGADVVSQAIYGSFVTILESRGGWLKIGTWDEYQGWVSSNVLAKQSRYPASQTIKVQNLFANVYQEADTTKHEPIFTLPYDSRLQVLGESEDNRWYKIRLVDGRDAWILQGDVILNPKNLSMKEMLELSHRFIGLPYLWGGVSAYGFDCSGFVQMLYKQMGVNLPRDGKPQAAWGGFVEVGRENLRPGDALYFGWDKKISHAGIYLGNNLYISSTAHKNPTIQIADLRDPHWRDIYITARRLDSGVQSMSEFKGGISEVSESLQAKMQKYTWKEGCPVMVDDLAEVHISYWGFDSQIHQGVLIVNKKLAQEILDIFKEIYQQKFPIAKIKPIEEYRGDDNLSMLDNNTSAFNCRAMTDFSDQYSVHSYGGAIDINPLVNPYVNGDKVEPAGSAKYIDRNVFSKGKIIAKGPVYQAFTARGWQWGGDASWDVLKKGIKDYQHFEKLVN
jgi:gamma-D-glutamyl-L-lysine dipeptidyl-peptidase